MDKAKQNGSRAGLICFSAFMAPWLILAFFAWTTAPEGFQGETLAAFLIGIGVFAFVSAFLGFSVTLNLKWLKIVAYLLIAAVPIIWIFWVIDWIP